MEQIKDRLTPEQIQKIQALRQMFIEPKEPKKDTLKNAIAEAEETTARTGLKGYVIRRKRKYYAVFEGFFDTYKYKGKIYYTSTPKLDEI